ncbi:hypothetical protein EJB05_42004, partial [Eragrostis curvula]
MAHQPEGGGGGGGSGAVPEFTPAAEEEEVPPPPGEGGEEEIPPAAEVDCISLRPREERWIILRSLSLKSLLRMAMASKGWFDSVRIPGLFDAKHSIRSAHDVRREMDKLNRGGRGDRIIRFALDIEKVEVSPNDFAFFLDYAADGNAECIRVVVKALPGSPAFSLSFQRSSQRLVRLWLEGVRVTEARHPTLEVIRIQSTNLDDDGLREMIRWCPRLRCLDLRGCNGITRVDVTNASVHLMRLTVVECPLVTEINASTAPRLCSFRYSGCNLTSLALSAASSFWDLYICFTKCRIPLDFGNWLNALPNLSNLTVLTISNTALRMVSILHKDEENTVVAKLSYLQSLRELQLLMFGMKTDSLSGVYEFFRISRCSKLRKLFVQLPKGGHDSCVDAVKMLNDDPPEDGFENLEMVKITNFKWHCNEIDLVHFLFSNASFLRKLVLVTSQGEVGEADLKLLGNPPKNAMISVLGRRIGERAAVGMALGSDGNGDGWSREKRRRVEEQGYRTAAAIPAVRFSALPIDLRQRILRLLPIKDAIRTAALDQGWRDIWKSRWHPTSSRDIHLLPGDNPNEVLDSLERGPRLRLDRFSLVVESEKLRPTHLNHFLAYAAECRVEDLHVERRHGKHQFGSTLFFHFPLSSPCLVHLSLRGIGISNMYQVDRPLSALEVIHLHSVRICELTFRNLMAMCPRLRTLDLRWCNCKGLFRGAQALAPPAGENLRSITVVECQGEVRLDVVAMPSLRSFCYSGNYGESPFFLPKDAAPVDLYICCGDPIFRPFTLFPNYFDEGLPQDLSRLTVLTICSNALKVASTWLNNGATAHWTSLCNLHSLRELQLLMFGMDANNLADIYVFLKASYCPSLERVFVQLPAISAVPLENLLEDVGVEPPEDGLGNLRMVKVMNFNWRCFEVLLVSFLLRKARSLHKLLLVSPNVTLLNVPGVPEADLLVIKNAMDNGRLMLSGSAAAATKPFHSEVFIDF